MRIEITNPNDILELDFGRWLCKRIESLIKSRIDKNKLKLWSEYLTKSNLFTPVYSDKIFADKILIQASESLTCKKFPSLLFIEIDSNKLVSGLDRVKLKTIVELITFGNQEKSGYPLIQDVFQEVADNISEYISKYMDGAITWQ